MSKSSYTLGLLLLLFALLVAGLFIVLWAAPEARAITTSTHFSTSDAISTAKISFFANPQVVGVDPISNTHTAPRTATVSITYNKEISAATVSTRTFAVHAMQTGLLAQAYSVNGGAISLTPPQPFKPGELVQTSATTGTLFTDATRPISPTVWQFWTAVEGGSGLFIDSGQSLGSSTTYAVALGDMDGDGDLDAFVANYDNQANKVWLNDGAGIFSDSGQTLSNSQSHAVALGDVDGDGDLDAFVGNTGNQPNKVWLNDGAGNFIDSLQSLGSSYSHGVALGDVDGDGDLDAFVANWNQASKVWVNDGTGSFTDSSQSLGLSYSNAVALGDVDGDGDLDAFVANDEGQANKVWLNNGAGIFSDSGQSLGSSNSRAVALGDVDGDGDLDAFVANDEGQANKVWLNDGTGTFTDSGQSLGSSYSYGVALGDVDSDGDLDAFVGNPLGVRANKVWLNDGAGTFTDSGQSLGSSQSWAVALGDVDSDGDLDAFVGNTDNQPNKVWLNRNTVSAASPVPNTHTATVTTNISATFTAPVSDTTVTTNTFFVHGGFHGHVNGSFSFPNNDIVFDPDEDFAPGELIQTTVVTDVHVGGLPLGSPYVWQIQTEVVEGSGLFIDSGQNLGNSDTRGVALGDLDGDGDLDAFAASHSSQANKVWINDSSGTFTDTLQSLGSSNSFAVALGDVDGDGDLDAFVGNEEQANTVWLNDGMGIFTDSLQSLGSSSSWAVALGDVDGDGDLDALVGNFDGQDNKVWRNDGSGNFTDSGQSLGSLASLGVALGDLDGDGDLDAFAANYWYGQANKVWINDGSGNFTDSGQSLGDYWSAAVALGDVDGDGDLDALVANDEQADKLWLNDGSGTFTDSGQELSSSASVAVALGDVDGDGDLDAFIGSYNNKANRVWLNDGSGNFTDSGQKLGSSNSRSVALGDVDGDGDLDAFAGNGYDSQPNKVWLNQSPPNLTISKTALATAMAGDLITYTLTITNSGEITATNLVITDAIPVGANYVSGGTRVGDVVSWTVGSLSGNGGWSQPTFVVTATQTIINRDYRVSASGGYSATGNVAVMTVINVCYAAITPLEPTDNDDLILSWHCEPGGGQMRWYRDGVLQSAFNDQSSVPGSATYLEETWHATVRPQDGKEYGPVAESNRVVIRPLDNHLPQALNAAITPAQPQSGQKLSLTYVYTDSDGDTEGNTQIRWYRDDKFQPAFNDEKEVPENVTLAGESWHVTIRPHDGQGYGLLVETASVPVSGETVNTPPQISDASINPGQPGDDEDLRLTYTYSDVDGDSEGNTEIFWYWYRNLEFQTGYTGLLTIPASATSAGDVWYAKVIPHDGKEYGPVAFADSIIIEQANVPPKALEVYLSPGHPGPDDSLTLRYVYYDPHDPEGKTRVRWTANGQSQPVFDDVTVVPAVATSADETWCVSVTPHDGEAYSDGNAVEDCVTIEASSNALPEAPDAHIEPQRPRSADDLELHYTYFDPDGDREGKSSIRWYKNGEQQASFDDQTVVSSTVTAPGDTWYATIKPHDGTDYGVLVSAPTVTVNTPPQAQDVHIEPPQPQDHQVLAVRYTYEDPDNDPAGVPQISWYLSDTLQSDYNDQEYLPTSATSVGDNWHATVALNDGIEYGPTVESNVVTIAASPSPTPSNIHLPVVARILVEPPRVCNPELYYEENDSPSQACELSPGKTYVAYPNDINDAYYFVLTQTTWVEVKVANYKASEPGRLFIYGSHDATKSIVMDPYLSHLDEMSGVPNKYYPDKVRLPPCPSLNAPYYLRIYTYDGTFNTTESYTLTINYYFYYK